MKKYIYYIFIVACIMLFCVNSNKVFAQLKVKGESGKVIIGQDRINDSIEDEHKVLSESIFGKQGFYKSGSKLAFGDFGRYEYWGWNDNKW